MTKKIYQDYLSMKEFTENAAHEMQTPIAVIQSKLEILLQGSNLSDEQSGSVIQATEALARLSKLNQGLLFLAKIENNQYQPVQLMSVAEITQKYLALFSEQIREKQLSVETDFSNDCSLFLHPLLADSLVSNLLGNAIKYNFQGGSIAISSTPDSLLISNSSKFEPLPKNKLFSRFSSGNNSSTGLGLAIIKKITERNNLRVDYNAEKGFHSIRITKRTSSE
jgi:signal transduction histidine kinase